MDEATELCDEVGMLYAGRLIRQDSPEVLRRLVPTREVEVELADLDAADRVGDSLRALRQVVEVRAQGEGRLRVRTEDPERDVRDLLAWAAGDGVPVAGVTVVRPELSDAFVRLVEEATGESAESLLASLGEPPQQAQRPRGMMRMRRGAHP
jgi:ABC-2 type transport system ATP-binding protein